MSVEEPLHNEITDEMVEAAQMEFIAQMWRVPYPCYEKMRAILKAALAVAVINGEEPPLEEGAA